ncbi:MAG: Arylsulfatase [Verrucomicrobiota bacterium]|jgi:arylsulfatase A-like enzyme
MKPHPLLLLLLAAVLPAALLPAADAPRPNIVFLMADDLGSADVGFNGGKEIRTPNLDRLAASGARLAQFYVQPVCSPTRAALMTGRYPMRHGLQTGVVRPWAQYGLPLDERILPQALREAGYTTALVGKWHLGHFRPEYLPTRRGFDRQYGHYNGALDYNTHERDGGFDWHRDDQVNREEGYSTHLLAREAVRLIRAQPAAQPLFLYVPFNAVHGPLQVPAKYKEPYAYLPEQRRTYAGMVAALDEAVGQIAAALEETGRRTNTLVFFCSDNGGPNPGRLTSNGNLRAGKGTLYEGGIRVCAFAAWPGRIPAGSVVQAPLHIVDCYPTFLRLAGARTDQNLPVDGRDAWPALSQGAPSPHDAILLNAAPNTGALRAGDWKLVLNGAAAAAESDENDPKETIRRAGRTKPSVELFNLASDPSEKTNLATNQPGKVKELRARYDALAAQQVAPKAAPKPAGFKTPKVWGESP